MEILVVPDDAQKADLLVGRIYTELKHIVYVRKQDKLIFGYAEQYPVKDIIVEELIGNLKAVNERNVNAKSVADVKVTDGRRNMVLRVYNTSDEVLQIAPRIDVSVSDEDEMRAEGKETFRKCREIIKMEMIKFRIT